MLKMHGVKQYVHFMNIQAVNLYHLFSFILTHGCDKRPWGEADAMVLCTF